MHISEKTLVSEIAAAVPSSVRVFQRFGVDFCCGGKRPLGVICKEQGLSFDEVAELEREMHVHVHLENNVLFPRALQ